MTWAYLDDVVVMADDWTEPLAREQLAAPNEGGQSYYQPEEVCFWGWHSHLPGPHCRWCYLEA